MLYYVYISSLFSKLLKIGKLAVASASLCATAGATAVYIYNDKLSTYDINFHADKHTKKINHASVHIGDVPWWYL